MNNQWGRSGNGQAPSGGGLGGVLFASVICLALGAGAGYGAFRMLDGAAPGNEIAERDRRIADLASELDTRAAQVEDANAHAALKRRLEAQRADGAGDDAANDAVAGAAAALAENRRLTQEVVPDLKNELELASQLLADAEALKKRAEETVRDRDRRLSLQADEIAQLKKDVDEALSKQNSARNEEAKRQEAERALQRELQEAQREKDMIQAKDMPALRDEIARKEREIAELEARNAALAGQVAALESAARAAALQGKPETAGEKPVPNEDKPKAGREPRSAVLVSLAIDNAPGLDRLTSGQREELEQTLIGGECVTKALDAVLKRVPVLPLRNLMRDLESDC
jgi:DNA repair exonuclease SbcCD ATPase subunit